MNSAESKVLPAPPNLVRSLLAGFDTIANNIGLIIFSIALDALLWFGSQIRIYHLVKAYLDWTMQATIQQAPELASTMSSSEKMLSLLAERFNLVSLLRAFPFGIPSLMAGRAPVDNPLGRPIAWEAPTAVWAFAFAVLFVLIGILLGTLYFSAISQVTVRGRVDIRSAFIGWFGKYIQLLLLCFFYLVLLIGISIPISCVLPFVMIGGGSAGRLVLFAYGAIILWLLFPLVLSPFGIFVYQDRMWISVMRGVRIARYTMTTTVLFVLIAVLMWQGLDMLWNIPVDTSWFMVVGILGHAFIITSLIAASFIYYRDAGVYVEQRLQQLRA